MKVKPMKINLQKGNEKALLTCLPGLSIGQAEGHCTHTHYSKMAAD